MATYTITGHPLNIHELAATPGAAIDANLTAALRDKGVGQTVTFVLSGTDDTKGKAHAAIR